MSLDKKIKFTKSLKFRLTIIYSLILFVFASSFVLAINIYLNNHFNREPEMPPQRMDSSFPMNLMIHFDDEQMEDIKEIRRQDLKRIQQVSLISLIPISLLSFLVGYVVSDRFLFPLKILQNKVDNLKDEDLGSAVEIHGDDEIGELAKSFNQMSKRLKKSFDQQIEFVQNASHELKTPLTVIQTNLDAALDDKNLTRKEMQESVKNALTGMKRVNKLTEYLLDLTLPTRQHRENVPLNKLLKGQVENLKPYAKELMVKLELKLPKETIKKKVDKILMSRAVYNLIDNAIKYSQEVERPRVKVTLESIKDKVKIIVSDNGKGIPKSKQDKIFERFYRVDKSRSRKTGGFGLGLAITKKIVEEHGGEVGFKSSSKGTSFWIIL